MGATLKLLGRSAISEFKSLFREMTVFYVYVTIYRRAAMTSKNYCSLLKLSANLLRQRLLSWQKSQVHH